MHPALPPPPEVELVVPPPDAEVELVVPPPDAEVELVVPPPDAEVELVVSPPVSGEFEVVALPPDPTDVLSNVYPSRPSTELHAGGARTKVTSAKATLSGGANRSRLAKDIVITS